MDNVKNKHQKQIKVQGMYRKMRQQDREDKNSNEFGIFGIVIIAIWILVFTLNAIFDI
ncbi:hypothetical protein [Sporosarcina globispora]|uniref:hypothetical protein n=1 Tax=Sporosarcina globispora TaxID=1459 RepID=UPI000AEF8F69|nr:hypothetical protein [Sporosarcina globispora]